MRSKILVLAVVISILMGMNLYSSKASLTFEEEYDTTYIVEEQILSYSPPTGIRTPAEWESVDEILLRWGGFLENYFVGLTREIAETVQANIVVDSENAIQDITDKLESEQVNMDNVSFSVIPTDSIWIRDYGPISVLDKTTGELSFVNMEYHRSGTGENPRPNDDMLPWYYAQEISVDCYNMSDGDKWFRLEGGNLMVDGAGIFYTTDRCFEQNDPSEGGYLDQEEVIQWATDHFDLEDFRSVQPLDTDGTGHIDMQIKLLNETTVLVSQVRSWEDNYAILEANAQFFENAKARNGEPYEVIRIPLRYGQNNRHFTYTNSLIINDRVLVPTYGQTTDSDALQIYEDAMPNHEIVGVDSSDIIPYFGAIHCSTMQVASSNAPPSIEIDNIVSVANEEVNIRASITDDGIVNSARLYYNSSQDDTIYTVNMELIGSELYEAILPAYPEGTDINFFIRAEDDHRAISYHGDYMNMETTIVEAAGDPPSVTLTRPNGGEIFNAGSLEDISWTSMEGENPIDRLDIWYSTNGGSSWIPIASGIPDDSPYTWEVPNDNSEECIVRIRIYDDTGRHSEDTSDGHFEIKGIPPSPPSDLVVEHYGEDETMMLFYEDFTGVSSGSIPAGWTRSHTHWGVVDNDEAGGVAPELRYLGSGFTSATYRCYTSAIDTTGYTELDLSFTHRYYHMMGSITLRVEASTDGSSWSTLWQHTGGSTGPAVVDLSLDTTDGVGSSTLYIAWTFVGRSNDARRWVIDDIALFTEVESDGDEHNLITWDASIDDPEGITHYNIYRSESYDGPWDTPIAAVDAAGQADYQYIDINRGAADGTLWWYVVRAVGDNGMEDGNTDAVREPGPTETFDIPLTEGGAADGWNFVSFNLIPDSASLEAILGDIDGSYDRVMYYDASTGRWLSYMPGRAERFNDLNTWGHHMGLWIKVNSGANLTVEGTLPTTTEVTLYPGWNMVGLPSRDPGNHGLPAEIDTVGYFDPSASGNLAYSYTPSTFVFEPGKGYWVHNPTSTTLTWTVDN